MAVACCISSPGLFRSLLTMPRLSLPGYPAVQRVLEFWLWILCACWRKCCLYVCISVCVLTLYVCWHNCCLYVYLCMHILSRWNAFACVPHIRSSLQNCLAVASQLSKEVDSFNKQQFDAWEVRLFSSQGHFLSTRGACTLHCLWCGLCRLAHQVFQGCVLCTAERQMNGWDLAMLVRTGLANYA
jgi:hypothetical protein